MNEKGKTNYEKMARNARFKTLFFKTVVGQQHIANTIKSTSNSKPWVDYIEKFILDCHLSSGENAELNFLHNKAQKVTDIPCGTELDYQYRKNIIKGHFESFDNSL